MDPTATTVDLSQLYPIAYPSSTPTASSGFNWNSLVQPLTTAASGILATRYAVPQLNPGQVIQTPTSYMAQGYPGNSILGPTTFGTSGFLPLLLLGGGVLVIMMIAKR